MSPLVQQCQKALNDISTQQTVELFRSLNILGYKEIKLPISSQEIVLFKSLLDMNHP